MGISRNSLHSIDDLREAARRRIPKLAFDYLDGGAGSEANLRRNLKGFEAVILRPEYLRDVSERSQKVTLFGHAYDAPIGVSPVGLANFIWPGTDGALAAMAARRNIPYILSGVATTSIETIAEIAPDHAWFQVILPERHETGFDMIRRAREAGMKVLVMTVDIPVPSKRLRDLRNNFMLPFKPDPGVLRNIAARPAWALATLRAGTPEFANLLPYMEPGTGSRSLAAAQALQTSANIGEDVIQRMRDAWPGPFVLKGVLSARTAEAARRAGVDGVIVSNHGGRQIESGPATIEALPEIVSAVGGDMTVMLDSGIRSGGDIVKAYALGAAYTFSGRCFVYGAGALGPSGGEHALDLLTDEVDRALAQIGATGMDELGADNIWAID